MNIILLWLYSGSHLEYECKGYACNFSINGFRVWVLRSSISTSPSPKYIHTYIHYSGTWVIEAFHISRPHGKSYWKSYNSMNSVIPTLY